MADLRNQEMTLVTPAVNSAERVGRRLPSWLLSSLIHLGLLLGLALLQLTIFSEREDPCSFTALSPNESLDGLMVELPDGEFSAYSLAVEAENSNFIDDDVTDAAMDGVESAGIADSGSGSKDVVISDAKDGTSVETGVVSAGSALAESAETGAVAKATTAVFPVAESNWFRFQVAPVPLDVVSAACDDWSVASGANLEAVEESIANSAANAVAARIESASFDEKQVTALRELPLPGPFAGLAATAGVTSALVLGMVAWDARSCADESFFLRHYGGEPWG